MSAFPPIVLQKSFCTGGQNFRGLQARFSCKDLGTSSPRAKLTGNFANAAEATRIVHRFVLRVLVKNSWRCNFRLLQHYPPNSGHTWARSKCPLSANNGSQSITWSARLSSVGGMITPSALAVLTLMVRRSSVGCSTGKSATLAPRRSFLTCRPHCR